jgi:hypothetical protein
VHCRLVDPKVSTHTISQYFAILAGWSRRGLHFQVRLPRRLSVS